jgi:hypothetical protein
MAILDTLKKKYYEMMNPVKQGISNVDNFVFHNPNTGFQRIASEIKNNPAQFNVLSRQNVQQNIPKAQYLSTVKTGIKPVDYTLNLGGNMASNTIKTFGSGQTQTGQGITAFKEGRPIEGILKTGFGLTKMAAVPVNPYFQGANLVASQPQKWGTPGLVSPDPTIDTNKDQLRRIAAGFMQGMSGEQSLASNVPDRNISLLGNEFDPYKFAGNMVGFTKNPMWKSIYPLTSKLEGIKIAGPAVNFIISRGIKGGTEGLLQGYAELPDNLTPQDRFKYLAKQGLFGAGSEIMVGAGGKAIARSMDTQAGQELTKILDSATGKIQKEWKKAWIPVEGSLDFKTGKRIVKPLWMEQLDKWVEKYNPGQSVSPVSRESFESAILKSEQPKGLTPEVTTPPSTLKSPEQLAEVPKTPLEQPVLPSDSPQVTPVQGKSSLSNIINPTEDLKNLYRSAGDKFNEAHYQVLSEMDVAYAGKRQATGSYSSGFPQWVSPELRDKKLFDKVMSNVLDPENIIQPKVGSKEFKLQNEILSEIEARSGIDGEGLRNAIPASKMKGVKLVSPVEKVEKAIVSGPVYHAEATPKMIEQAKLKGIKLDEANRIKAETASYKEWQKQVFGEANTRSTKKAVDDMARAIKKNTNEASFSLDKADGWKDKATLSLSRETMDRNFEDIMGKDAPELKRKLLDPIYRAEAERNRFLNKERAEIANLGIKQGSKDSALVQQYGEGLITSDQLKSQTKNSDQVIKAANLIRSKYDKYLEQLNTVLTRNGYDAVPKRSDYFHHFQELGTIFDTIGVSLKAHDLPTDINGLSADFKPGRQFFSATLRRKGEQTAVDAIGGIDKYLEGASNQIYHTDNIQALRAFENSIREKYTGTTHLSNFVANLGEYTNTLAGKKSMIDRATESLVGRGIYSAATNLKKQVGANMVGANISSALTNFIPLTQTLATTNKASVLQSLMATLKNTFKNDDFIANSNFLTTRVGSDPLTKNLYSKVADKAGWLFKNVDSFVSQVVVRSKYLEGIKKGMSETSAMKYADDWGRKLLAGRGKGEMPTLFNSKTLGMLTQFQLEVNNQLSFMAKDIPRNFDKAGAASAIAQLFVYGYLFNNVYEKLTGRRPAFDPIGVAKNSYEDYKNPEMKKGQATKNLVSNVSNQLPFVSTFTGGRLPIGSAIPSPMAMVDGSSTVKKELMKPLQFLLPTGGGQIKKTYEGLKAYKQGASTSPSGGVRFPIEKNVPNLIKSAVFGQYSTPEAAKYFREGKTPLGEKQSQQVLNSANNVETFSNIRSQQKDESQITKLKEEVKNTGQMQVIDKGTTGKVYLYPSEQFNSETGEMESVVKKLDLSKPIPELKLSGQKELDKRRTASYKSAITSRINAIEKLNELGKISDVEAEKEIVKLKTTYPKSAKKPSLAGLKSPKLAKIKLSKMKSPKIKLAKIKTKTYKFNKIKIAKAKAIKLKKIA